MVLSPRSVRFKKLPALGLRAGDRAVTLMAEGDTLSVVDGVDRAGIVAELEADALSDLLQDRQSTMGLAMTSRVQITAGSLDEWIHWEPALRALCEGRPVHEPGAVVMRDLDGEPLDLDRRFGLDDDPEELAHFLAEAGFLHLHDVFDPSEMAAIEADIDQSIAAARDADPEYWWCTDADGTQVAVRSLNFQEKSAAVRATLADERLTRLADLTGDGHRAPTKCEGLVKPLDIVAGLSDLPWHKDCGQGLHSYMCNSLTVGISVTGADRVSGALGVVAGSHRANTTASVRDKRLDLPAKLLETTTGDLTIHCSDTLHRAYPPSAHPQGRLHELHAAAAARRRSCGKPALQPGSPQRVDRRAGADRRIGQPRRQQPVRAPQRLTASSPRVLDLGDRFRRGRNLVSPLLRRRP